MNTSVVQLRALFQGMTRHVACRSIHSMLDGANSLLGQVLANLDPIKVAVLFESLLACSWLAVLAEVVVPYLKMAEL